MRRIAILITALGLLATACSSDDGGSATTSSVPTTTQATTATTTTIATTTTTVAERDITTAPVVPGADPDADAIVALFAVVFDSATTFDEKAPLIGDPTGLESAVAGYQAAGDAVGGISLEVTQTGVLDDRAAVVYDLLFGENPFQVDQTGEAIRVENTWVVSRDYFCSIVALARVACP